jgi:hypothetical protein
MNADREANHDMTDRDIALLLADAADGVEIGIAPTQAVIRGGRRRRARRWAVATAVALAIVGSTGTIALAGLPGGDGQRVGPVATQPPTTGVRDVFAPHRTVLASGTEAGKDWQVFVDVWEAPRDETEAQDQMKAMTEYEEEPPPDVHKASDLVGRSTYFVQRSYGGKSSLVIENAVPKGGTQSGTDLDAGAIGLQPGSGGSARLVIGRIAKTAQQVTCVWKDGTSTNLHRVPANGSTGNVQQGIRSAEGSPDGWFVCLAPEGTAYESAEVTK